MIVELSNQLSSRIIEKAAAEAPYEACGLLMGVVTRASVAVEEIVFSNNVANDDRRYSFEVDPILHLRLQKESRTGGRAIVGVWHSHPTSVALPSDEDARRSAEKGWLWLITGRENGGWKTDAFLAGNTDPHSLKSAQIRAV